MKAIILVAGFGTRLYPLTRNIPKALLMIGNKTILDCLVEKLEALTAIDEIILVSNGRFYVDFLQWQQESHYQKPIHIISNEVFEPEKRLGAIRDLNLALRAGYCGSDDFMVFCGDNYFDFPLSHFLLPCMSHRDSAFIGVYDVKERSVASECGVVLMDDHNLITRFEEKPACPQSSKVSVGVYYLPGTFRLRIYEYLEIDRRNPEKIGDFIAWLCKKEKVYGVDFDGAWVDIGNAKTYSQAEKYFNAA